ncbi:MAG: hypothetical protein HYV09_26225 [Deltaproteobacteria bacterium]|nr:hypothetical protein [Deltaproteobacteria bacterium]
MILGYLAAVGAFSAFVGAVLVYVPRYTALTFRAQDLPLAIVRALFDSIFRFSAYNVVGILALFLLRPTSSRERAGAAFLGGVIAVCLVGVALQAKFFEYHYGAAPPFAGLLAGWGLFKVWRAARRSFLGAARS